MKSSAELREEIESIQRDMQDELSLLACSRAIERIRELRMRLWEAGECCGARTGDVGCWCPSLWARRETDKHLCDRRTA